MGPIEIILIVLLLVVVGVVGWGLSAYNGFIRQRNLIQESWRQVDVELNRRYELIPNLVETVRAFAGHERNTLEGIVRLRSQAQQLSSSEHGEVPSAERAQVEEQLTGAVRGLMVSVEAYPELKSNQNFLELQRQLAETEDRIAAGRRYYNANVRNYNTRIESVPSNMIANQFNFQKATYFEVNDPEVRSTPNVSFGEISYRGDAPAGGGATPASGQLGTSAPNELPNPQGQERGPIQFDQQSQFDQQPQQADRPAQYPDGTEPPAQR
ncbi:LemA family protein [Propioniciclava soli]|uniref:LemA family protein n=1 Tax=Propioniciclava soli TaxID=2775081 RepID=UPI001E3DF449|nr:LemA family protein [Propioniciclava soli]